MCRRTVLAPHIARVAEVSARHQRGKMIADDDYYNVLEHEFHADDDSFLL
jgi:hypothetical protein